MAWLRMFGAMVIAAAIVRPRRLSLRKWSRADLKSAAIFGLSTGLTSSFFYMAIDRLPLGKGVAIEFIGPITVAAIFTRTRRNALALLVAVVGVAVLTGVEIGDESLGVLFILLAAASWAVHIVYGSRVANAHTGLEGLAMSFVMGTLLTLPLGAADFDAVARQPSLVAIGVAVGALASVVSYGTDQRILRLVSVRHYSVLLAMLPIVASLFGFAFFDQTPTSWDLIGVALIVTGIAIQERR
jgi:inner membrane transporter RhtA